MTAASGRVTAAKRKNNNKNTKNNKTEHTLQKHKTEHTLQKHAAEETHAMIFFLKTAVPHSESKTGTYGTYVSNLSKLHKCYISAIISYIHR